MTLDTVLLVEDEPDIQFVARLTLKKGGVRQVVLASDGEECLARVGEVKPDLILLDVMMPKIDGYETCRRLKQNPETRHIPVIFLTAKAQQYEKNLGLELGALGYLVKPFDPATLHAEIVSLLRNRGT